MSSATVGIPKLSSAACTSLTPMPSPDGRENSPSNAMPGPTGGAGWVGFGAVRVVAARINARRGPAGRSRQARCRGEIVARVTASG